MNTWQSIKAWLYAPFQQPQDPVNWALLIVMSATIAYAWTRILNKVLEE